MEIDEQDLRDAHPVTLAEVKYLLEDVKERSSLDNRSSSYKILKQTLNYVEKFCKIEEKSMAEDLRSSLFNCGCNEVEIALLGSIFPQSVDEAKMLIPSLKNKDNAVLSKIVDLVIKYI
ncbi:DNA-directed RNA polymerase II 16 kDa polypeptide [Vairimorpha necatrix]|uniref:DNA-directed RNA polymerase II 16 kDa polypeptide n=1 Tax=Vairimorpha necatrix TaxID=6039 RepID=A0AAX4JA17_9MICR